MREIINKKNYKENERRYKDWSKDKLIDSCESKIKTTMIGAIAAMEKQLGHLMENDSIREKFLDIRETILDQGNSQIRKMKDELENYEVEWLKYRIEFRRKQ